MADESQTAPLTDAQFIELLWKCADYGAMLMPSDTPPSQLQRDWSEALEDATVEMSRRETANGK